MGSLFSFFTHHSVAAQFIAQCPDEHGANIKMRDESRRYAYGAA
jgi:hypothetical protein